MSKLKFTATPKFAEYHGNVNAKDGETVIVTDEVYAKRLLDDFPKNFALVTEASAEAPKDVQPDAGKNTGKR